MIIELHCHTREHSKCSNADAAELLRFAYRAKAQGLVLTDHEYLWSEEEIGELKSRSGMQEQFLVLSGQEVRTRDWGDVLVYGAAESIERGVSLDEVRRRWPEAAIVWAHPYRKGREPADHELLDDRLDGIEIFSSNHSASESSRALKDWHRLRFTAISGTDAHNKTSVGAYPTVFDHPIKDAKELASEIKAGRCRPYFKQQPEGGTSRTEVVAISIGREESDKRQDLIIKTYQDREAWKEGKRSHDIMKAISDCMGSERFRTPKPYGSSEEGYVIVEERLSGATLFESIVSSTGEHAEKILRLTAQWLARLHNCKLRITPVNEFIEIEPERLNWYLSGMREHDHKHLERAQDVLDHVLEKEKAIYRDRQGMLVQGHGDFHPKNIFTEEDENGLYLGAIDFDSSYVLPPAFDVGTFLAQFMNQFYHEPEVEERISNEVFLEAYMRHADEPGEDFISQVNLFKARCCLSIIYYLVKVGLGDSENFWHVLVEAERSLSHSEYREIG